MDKSWNTNAFVKSPKNNLSPYTIISKQKILCFGISLVAVVVPPCILIYHAVQNCSLTLIVGFHRIFQSWSDLLWFLNAFAIAMKSFCHSCEVWILEFRSYESLALPIPISTHTRIKPLMVFYHS